MKKQFVLEEKVDRLIEKVVARKKWGFEGS